MYTKSDVTLVLESFCKWDLTLLSVCVNISVNKLLKIDVEKVQIKL